MKPLIKKTMVIICLLIWCLFMLMTGIGMAAGACEGDFGHDGDVDGSDLAVFAADFGRTNCSPELPCQGNFDGDTDVDGSDLAVFAADFGRTDCPIPSENIASLASVTASSENVANDQLAIKAVDGVIDGYPGDSTKEWATVHEKKGAWLQLVWSGAYLVDRIILYDRPNTSDQIIDAYIDFSDGSRLWVGPLDNAGGPNEYTFNDKIITSLKVNVFKVSDNTGNIGLAEIEVFGRSCIPPYVRIGTPHSYALQTSSDLNIKAAACLQDASQGVRILVDGGYASGGDQFDDYEAPYVHHFFKFERIGACGGCPDYRWIRR